MWWLLRTGLLALLIFTFVGESYADRNQYSFEFEDTRLLEVISEIARETDMDLSFDPAIIPDERVTHSFSDETATSILFEVLRPHRLTSYILPNGVFVIAQTIKREVEAPQVSRFGRPNYDAMNGRISSYNDATIYLRSVGSANRKFEKNDNGEVSIPSFTKPMLLYLIGESSKPLRVSPFEINDGFELEAEPIPRNHPYPRP